MFAGRIGAIVFSKRRNMNKPRRRLSEQELDKLKPAERKCALHSLIPLEIYREYHLRQGYQREHLNEVEVPEGPLWRLVHGPDVLGCKHFHHLSDLRGAHDHEAPLVSETLYSLSLASSCSA